MWAVTLRRGATPAPGIQGLSWSWCRFPCVFAQVKLSLRTVSVAVRVPGREESRGHGHIADSVAAQKTMRQHLRRSITMWSNRQ